MNLRTALTVSYALIEDTFASLENYADVLSAFEDTDSLETEQMIREIRIGSLHMNGRLYLPDGRAFTENGLITDASDHVSFEEISGLLDDSGRYISLTKNDFLNSDASVKEFFVPVKVDGRNAALLSAVMDLKELPQHLSSAAYDGQAVIMLLDTRDHLFFMDGRHQDVSELAEYRSYVDKRGKSNETLINDLVSGREVTTAIVSQQFSSPVYYCAIPSKIEGWSTGLIIGEKAAFADSIAIRDLMTGRISKMRRLMPV